jgi:GntR family transcriptional regulator, transcriptional repressor for pyruvate dehydrogenase complex
MRNNTAVEPLVVAPAYAVVVDHLRRAIHLGIYGPGDKLPPERTLAPQLGVSRVTLREAVRVLEAEGYLQVRRGATGGVMVRERSGSPEELLQEVRASRDTLGALLEFRLVNERLAAERAASRVTAADLEALQATVAAMRESEGIGPFRHADSEFHLRIAAAADCEVLWRAIEDARVAMFLAVDVLQYDVMLASTIRGHERVLAALRAGDARAAGRAMAAHVKVTTRELDAMLDAS